MSRYLAKVGCLFNIEIEEEDVASAREYIQLSNIRDLLDYECDYNDSIEYVVVKDIKEI